jgi:hypothetical protein
MGISSHEYSFVVQTLTVHKGEGEHAEKVHTFGKYQL